MTYPQPPGDPNQQPAYPPPQYPPTYPPAAPSQPAGYPGQPPAYPPGYASPSMPMYQQPPQPYPYAQQPGMQPVAGGAVNFAMLTQPQQRGFFVVGIGAVVMLIGFFLLPVYTLSIASSYYYPGGSTIVHASDTGFWGWIPFLCSVVAGGLAVWRAITPQPMGLTRKGASITAIVLGSVATLFMLLVTLFFSTFSGSGFGASASVSFGAFVLLAATVAILVGGIMQINTRP